MQWKRESKIRYYQEIGFFESFETQLSLNCLFFFFLKHFPFLRLKPRFRRVKPFPFFQGSNYWQEPWYSRVLPKGLQTWPPFCLVTDGGPEHATKFHNQKTPLLHDDLLQHCSGKSAQEENVCWKIHGAQPPAAGWQGFGTGTCNVPKHPAMEKCPEFQVLYLGSISTWALACRNGIHCSMDKFQELFPCAVNAKTGPSRLLLKCCCQAIKCLKSPELKEALCMYSPRCS